MSEVRDPQGQRAPDRGLDISEQFIDGRLQAELRKIVTDSYGYPVNLHLSGMFEDNVTLITSPAEAKRLLSLPQRKHTSGSDEVDTTTDGIEMALNAASRYIREHTPQVLTSERRHNFRESLTKQFNVQEALEWDLLPELYQVISPLFHELLFGDSSIRYFDDGDVLEILDGDPAVVVEKLTSANPSIRESEIVALIAGTAGHEFVGRALAILLAASVSPTANFCGLGVLVYHTEFREVDSSSHDVLRSVCLRHSPIFPGIFRQASNDLNPVLIPATWPDGQTDLTFGFGPHRCPGRGFAATVFDDVLQCWKRSGLQIAMAEGRTRPPFGLGKLRVRHPSESPDGA